MHVCSLISKVSSAFMTYSSHNLNIPYLSTLRVTSELSSEVHSIPNLLKIFSTLRFSLFRKLQLRTKKLQQQIT